MGAGLVWRFLTAFAGGVIGVCRSQSSWEWGKCPAWMGAGLVRRFLTAFAGGVIGVCRSQSSWEWGQVPCMDGRWVGVEVFDGIRWRGYWCVSFPVELGMGQVPFMDDTLEMWVTFP